MKYKYLTIEERYHIQTYKEAGYFQKQIAKKLQVSTAAICGELKRNLSYLLFSYEIIYAHLLKRHNVV